jgi:DNA-binding transcriptional LysR family regulator
MALPAAFLAALPALLVTGFPGNEVVPFRIVRSGTSWATTTAAVLFWTFGRNPPLRASFVRTIGAALVAGLGVVLLLRYAARSEWLSGNHVILGGLLLLATVGYLPFRRSEG